VIRCRLISTLLCFCIMRASVLICGLTFCKQSSCPMRSTCLVHLAEAWYWYICRGSHQALFPSLPVPISPLPPCNRHTSVLPFIIMLIGVHRSIVGLTAVSAVPRRYHSATEHHRTRQDLVSVQTTSLPLHFLRPKCSVLHQLASLVA
jgi:hypothetical protein